MRAVGLMAIFLALFAVTWLWTVNGRPRTPTTALTYLAITATCTALAYGGAIAWNT